MNKIKYIFFGVCLVAILWFVISHQKIKKIPAISLKDINGNSHTINHTNNKEYGVIYYISKAPCGSHPDVAQKISNYYPIIEQSKRYQPYFIYGDETTEIAKTFAENYDAPILLDGGLTTAEQLNVNEYYATIIFNEKGKIKYRRDGIILHPRSNDKILETLDYFLDKY